MFLPLPFSTMAPRRKPLWSIPFFCSNIRLLLLITNYYCQQSICSQSSNYLILHWNDWALWTFSSCSHLARRNWQVFGCWCVVEAITRIWSTFWQRQWILQFFFFRPLSLSTSYKALCQTHKKDKTFRQKSNQGYKPLIFFQLCKILCLVWKWYLSKISSSWIPNPYETFWLILFSWRFCRLNVFFEATVSFLSSEDWQEKVRRTLRS